MNLIDLGKEIISLGAPLLGQAIAGPVGAEMASKLVSVFGGDPSNVDDLFSRMANDPDLKIKLAQIESDNLRIQLLSDDHIADDDIKDVEDARKMQVETHDWFPKALSIIIIINFIADFTVLSLRPVYIQNTYYIGAMISIICFAFMMVCRFWLGGVLPDISKLKDGFK